MNSLCVCVSVCVWLSVCVCVCLLNGHKYHICSPQSLVATFTHTFLRLALAHFLIGTIEVLLFIPRRSSTLKPNLVIFPFLEWLSSQREDSLFFSGVWKSTFFTLKSLRAFPHPRVLIALSIHGKVLAVWRETFFFCVRHSWKCARRERRKRGEGKGTCCGERMVWK